MEVVSIFLKGVYYCVQSSCILQSSCVTAVWIKQIQKHTVLSEILIQRGM